MMIPSPHKHHPPLICVQSLVVSFPFPDPIARLSQPRDSEQIKQSEQTRASNVEHVNENQLFYSQLMRQIFMHSPFALRIANMCISIIHELINAQQIVGFALTHSVR
jgi:hypothetical protein